MSHWVAPGAAALGEVTFIQYCVCARPLGTVAGVTSLNIHTCSEREIPFITLLTVQKLRFGAAWNGMEWRHLQRIYYRKSPCSHLMFPFCAHSVWTTLFMTSGRGGPLMCSVVLCVSPLCVCVWGGQLCPSVHQSL